MAATSSADGTTGRRRNLQTAGVLSELVGGDCLIAGKDVTGSS